MPVTFGREIINREVHDSADDRLGSVTDFTIDIESGQITNILVMIEPDINPQLLPWPTVNGLLSVPVEEIDTCLLYTSPSPRDMRRSRMPSSA